MKLLRQVNFKKLFSDQRENGVDFLQWFIANVFEETKEVKTTSSEDLVFIEINNGSCLFLKVAAIGAINAPIGDMQTLDYLHRFMSVACARSSRKQTVQMLEELVSGETIMGFGKKPMITSRDAKDILELLHAKQDQTEYDADVNLDLEK